MVGLILQKRRKRQQCHERGNHQPVQNRDGSGSDEASDGHLIICLLRSRLRNERTARDLRGSAIPSMPKDSKLSRMDMKDLLTREGIPFPPSVRVTWHTSWLRCDWRRQPAFAWF